MGVEGECLKSGRMFCVDLTRGSLEKPVLVLESDLCLSRPELPADTEGVGDEAKLAGLPLFLQLNEAGLSIPSWALRRGEG